MEHFVHHALVPTADGGVLAVDGRLPTFEAPTWRLPEVRAGLAPYSDDDDVERLLAGVADLCP